MADFLKIGIWDIAMTCTNIYLGQTLLKLLKLLGHTHSTKESMNWLFDPADF